MQERESRFVQRTQQIVDEEMQIRTVLRSPTSSLQSETLLGIEDVQDEHSETESQGSQHRPRPNNRARTPSTGSKSTNVSSTARAGTPQGTPGNPGTPRQRTKSLGQVTERLMGS